MSDATVKRAMQNMKNRWRPTIVLSQPVMGKTMAFDTRYEVNTQVLWS
jgi:hypothetical protein